LRVRRDLGLSANRHTFRGRVLEAWAPSAVGPTAGSLLTKHDLQSWTLDERDDLIT
jgi:hypothetical protein